MGNKSTKSFVGVDSETKDEVNNISNQITISLTPDAQQGILQRGGASKIKKYIVVNDEQVEIMSGFELEPNINSPLKTISLVDSTGSPQLKIVHRVGLSVVSICSVEGFMLGETNVQISFGCFCVIKPIYTYRLKSGSEIFTMDGNISCWTPRLKIQVNGQDKKCIAMIEMGDTLSFHCKVKFMPGKCSDNERKTILALCIGMLDSSFEKQLIGNRGGITKEDIKEEKSDTKEHIKVIKEEKRDTIDTKEQNSTV